jgi:hypothetical protein
MLQHAEEVEAQHSPEFRTTPPQFQNRFHQLVLSHEEGITTCAEVVSDRCELALESLTPDPSTLRE